ncbi:MAG: molybdopterin-dependent oxidoreductase [Deltaproteobacteria bacterium]|nr:molybdopterin-dependent oxidoreductase [Deltaproteobacteria bacterium]
MGLLQRRDFLKAAAAATGAAVATVGAIRSFIPKARAGESLSGRIDRVPVVHGNFASYPPTEKWDSWRELSGDDHKRGGALRTDVKSHEYMLVPTICNNCEAACGLTAWVDKETFVVRKYMGNPLHTGSRGRNCAKGYAVQSQMYDPDRIPFPLKRAPGSKRGDGKWVRTTWDEALAAIGAKMREALSSGDELSKKSIMHHVGRPNESGFTPRVWASLGQDCQNSHTNICSASGRFGSLAWVNDDRSAPDWERSRLILLVSSHAADAGHYFQQSAAQIAKARKKGAKLVVLDPRLSNSAGIADLWIPCWPGSEAAIHLALAGRLIREGRYDHEFVRQWWNWQDLMDDADELALLVKLGFLGEMPKSDDFEAFERVLVDLYGRYTLEWAAAEARVPVSKLEQLYEYIVYAGDRITSFYWRSTGAGNRGGWMTSSRTGIFLLALTGNFNGVGALGVEEGRMIAVAGKGGKATISESPPKVGAWNELSWPPEWPLAAYELSFLLPHLLSDTEWQDRWRSRGLSVPKKLAVWIPRQYNPVWINPDGFRWIEVLKDESKLELTFNPSPIWSETNWFMDYILPVGLSGERHDQHSEPTNTEAWIGFRQPVLRVALEKSGWIPKDPARATLEAHMKAGLGEIWEENELWINLIFHHVDPDGSLGIRGFWESRANPGKPVTIAEYYNAAFATLPRLRAAAEAAAREKKAKAKTPLENQLAEFALQYPCYDLLRDRGAWTEKRDVYLQHEEELAIDETKRVVAAKSPQFWGGKVEYPLKDLKTDPRTSQLYVETPEGRHNLGVKDERGALVTGFGTPSRKMELYAKWLKDWGWPEYALPIYPITDEQRTAMIHIVSHVHHRYMTEPNAFALNPIYRLPYNIHTRGVNSKWLMEISQNHNPVWMNTKDASRLGFQRGEAVRVRVVDTLSGKESGYFIAQCQPTEGMAPGVLACSHHAGRWRLVAEVPIEGAEQPLHVMRVGAPEAKISESGATRALGYSRGIEPFEVKPTKEFGEQGWPFASMNQDLDNITWDGLSGVWQNAVHHPHPDPISGMHCWHQKVLLEKAAPGEKIGDLKVDISATFETYRAWRDQLTRPAPGPGNLRRPEHLKRPWVALTREAYQLGKKA